MKLLLKTLIFSFAFIFAAQLSFAQSPQTTPTEVEAFKEKLQKYFNKHKRTDHSRMPVKPLDSTNSDMPTGNLKSLMIDKEIGVAFEFSTKKIYDQETDLVYDMKTNEIYNPKTQEFHDFDPRSNEYLYFREIAFQ